MSCSSVNATEQAEGFCLEDGLKVVHIVHNNEEWSIIFRDRFANAHKEFVHRNVWLKLFGGRRHVEGNLTKGDAITSQAMGFHALLLYVNSFYICSVFACSTYQLSKHCFVVALQKLRAHYKHLGICNNSFVNN